MVNRKVAIWGDNFITTASVRMRLEELGEPFEYREGQNSWPDEPMNLVAKTADLKGLREYVGSARETVDLASGAEIFVNHLAPVSAGVLDELPDLRLLVVTRGGPVNIDAAAAKERGVRLVNMPGRNASAVAEFTIGLMLAQTRHIRSGHESLRSGEWRGDLYRKDRSGREIGELTVGVVGYGKVGSLVTGLLLAFGPRILVHDPFKELSQEHRDAGVEAAGIDRLLAESDVVSLHSRLQADGSNRFDRSFFSRMRDGAIFVNTARGVMVDYADLHAALTEGPLDSAALDTFDDEPPLGSPILRLPNVTLTPHLAGSSRRTVDVTAQMAAEEVRRYLAGEDPLNPFG